ncbi:MAG TPA: type II secretion system F family protein [Candidatus Binataceae bacterium]|nr:type II secretion system F family protein [Candidatus Binataceae bacterium]
MEIIVAFLFVLFMSMALLLYLGRRREWRRRERVAVTRLSGGAAAVPTADVPSVSATPHAQVNSRWPLRPIADAVQQAGLQVAPSLIVGSMALLLCAGTAIAALRFQLLVAFGCGAALAWTPLLFLNFKRQRRLRAIAQQLPYVLDLLRTALESGHTLLRGIKMASENLPEPMASELRILVEHVRVGMSLPVAVDAMHQRIPVEELGFLAAAVRVQSDIGSSLANILENVATSTRNRQRLRDQIRTLTAQSRVSAMIVSLLPVVILGIFELLRPGYAAPLFNHPVGIKLLEAAIIMDVLAVLAMRHITKVDY